MLKITQVPGYKPVRSSELPTDKPSAEVLQVAKRAIDAARLRILQHKAFQSFSGVAACGETRFDHKFPTACTDGWNVDYNPYLVLDFLKAGKAYVNFLVLHETWHKAFCHAGSKSPYVRLFRKNPSLYMWAADAFINTALVQIDEETRGVRPGSPQSKDTPPFILMPEWCVQHMDFLRGKSMAEIFKWGEEQIKKQQDWLEQLLKDLDLDIVVHSDDPTNKPADPQAAIQREILAASTTGDLLKRSEGSYGRERGSDLAGSLLGQLTKPKISYVELMRDWFKQTNVPGNGFSSWARINRRHLAQGTYMPGTMSVEGGTLVVEVDTSGSCWTEVPEFMSELQGVIEDVKPREVHVLWVDTEVRRHDVLTGRRLQELDQLTPYGQGGTDMRIGFAYAKEKEIKADGYIVFTDGDTPYPEEGSIEVPNLWVISNRRRKSPVGTTVHLDINA